jgi:hypothetical protein
MSQESPSSHQAQITSTRDLTDLCEVEDYETGAVLRTTFTFVDADHTVWFGRIDGVRKYDLTGELLRENLRRIPDETVYPAITSGLTIVPNDSDMTDIYIKRPKLLCLDDEEETKLLPRMLAEEADVLEALNLHPHRNLVRYHCCTGARGRIVGLALEKHGTILQYRFEDDPRELDLAACIGGLRVGVKHLHALGYAHNDLNPMNVAMDKDDRPVILDFGSCRKFGEALLSGGTPGWIDEDYSTSAAHQDLSALRRLEVWLEKRRAERRVGEASGGLDGGAVQRLALRKFEDHNRGKSSMPEFLGGSLTLSRRLLEHLFSQKLHKPFPASLTSHQNPAKRGSSPWGLFA